MHKPFEHLLPKVIAGGLSAGLVLVWWPTIFPDTSGAASWVWRGLVWTLIFELLLGLLVPLQEKITNHRWGQKAQELIRRQGNSLRRLAPESAVLSVAVLAGVALALPAGLIVSGPNQAKSKAQAQTAKVVKPVKVIRVTKVIKKKEVKIVPKIKREVRIVRLPAKTQSPSESKPKTEKSEPKPEEPAPETESKSDETVTAK